MPYPILYFFCYSLVGWILESVLSSVYHRKPINKGILSGPFSPLNGVIVLFGVYFLEPMENPLLFLVFALCVIAGLCEYAFCALTKQYLHLRLWDYSEYRWNLRGYTCLRSILFRAIPAALAVRYLHPLVVRGCGLIPREFAWVCAVGLLVLLSFDYLVTVSGARSLLKDRIEQRISRSHWYTRHLSKSDARLTEVPDPERRVFARGVGGYKLFWIFVIGALIGDVIETLFIYATAGVWMSRSSLLYGPFSVVWGFGGVVLTVVLRSWSGKSDRYIFLGGMLIGGVYEYVCSVFTEYCFGMVFWDYSHIPFNINGRINLLYCGFWGLLALIWVKGIYPRLSALIERIPVRIGKITTWVLALFLSVSALLSCAALARMSARAAGDAAENPIEVFLDRAYPDEYLAHRYQNLIEK